MYSAWQPAVSGGFLEGVSHFATHLLQIWAFAPGSRAVLRSRRVPVPVAVRNLHALRCERCLSPYRSIDRAGPVCGTLLATGAGVHLVEVLIAASLLAGVCLSLPTAFVGAVRANRAAGEATWTTVLAAQKVEELRSGPFPPAAVLESSDLLGEAGEPVDGSSSIARLRSRLADRTACVCARQHSRHHGSRRAVPARCAEWR